MAQLNRNRTRLAVIGGAVSVATVGVIGLLVFKGKPADDKATDLSARAAAVPSLPNQNIEGGVVKPWDAKPPTAAEIAEAAEAVKAEKSELERETAAAKAAEKQAVAEAARQKALDEARIGILGRMQTGGAFASLTGAGDISSGFDDTNIYGGLIGNTAGDMNGGFGYGSSGFGPGGGGTGWGTIGTGRGSATGSGYGVGGRGGIRGRTTAVPTISIGQPTVRPTAAGGDGELDKAIIRRYIKRNIQKLQYCYEKELLAKAKLAGTVQTQFAISDNGNVSSVTASGVDAEVSTCMANVIKSIEFPKPKGTGGVTVSYPFTVKPSGS